MSGRAITAETLSTPLGPQASETESQFQGNGEIESQFRR